MHSGGSDKWADLHMTSDDISGIVDAFKLDLGSVTSKAGYSKVMDSYVNDLARLPEEEKKSMRVLCVTVQQKLNTKKEVNNGEQRS